MKIKELKLVSLLVLDVLETTQAFHYYLVSVLPKRPLSIPVLELHHYAAAKSSLSPFSSSSPIKNINVALTKKKRNPSLKLSSPVSLPVIKSNDSWGNVASICSIASLSHMLGKTTGIGRLLGPPVTAMAIAFLLGSIGFLPSGGSPATKSLQLLCIQLATPLLLFGVNIKQCKERCGPLLLAFITATMGTAVAAIVAYPVCANLLFNAMGSDGIKIAAALMAKNIGGGINYIAVCNHLSASPNAIAAGLCVDNIFALIYFPATSAIAAGRPDPSSSCTMDIRTDREFTHHCIGDDNNHSKTINAETISASFAIATIFVWLGQKIGGQSSGLPLTTLFTILFTMVFSSSATSLSTTGESLGTALLYIFFATAGAPGLSVAESLKSSFIPIAFFLTILYGFHGISLVMVRKIILSWQKLKKGLSGTEDEASSNNSFVQPSRLLVASSAAIGGPATAAALAKANNWESLVGPSLIVGNLGYAVATFAGIVFHKVFS